MTRQRALCLLALLLSLPAGAHVGSPDVYLDGMAGPYQVSVAVRPPAVIPGLAEIELRTPASGIHTVNATVLMMTGAGSQQAPSPEILRPDPAEPRCWRGQIWFMLEGALRLQFTVTGSLGGGTLDLPVASAAIATTPMSGLVKLILSLLGTTLIIGVVAVIGMANGESLLPAGQPLSAPQRRKKGQAQAAALLSVIALLCGGKIWWNAQQAAAEKRLYRPAAMQAEVKDGVLTLTLGSNGWYQTQALDELLPDHGHLMHLYLVRWPPLDVALHLHPTLVKPGVFTQTLPGMPAGNYRLFGDIVHADGYAETLTAALTLNPLHAGPPQGDDAIGFAKPFEKHWISKSPLADGNQMLLLNSPNPVAVGRPIDWRVEIQDAQGKPLNDLVPYMGMMGHAAFLNSDGTTFAHTHPSGSVSMAALNLLAPKKEMPMNMEMTGANSSVTFPYGLPKKGWYRLIVQVRRPNAIETGFFNVQAR